MATEKLHAKKRKGWLTAGPWKRESRQGTYSIRYSGHRKYKCFGVSGTQGPTQGIAGNEAEERRRGVQEYVNICHAHVSQLCPEGSWRALRIGEPWSILYH